MGEFMGYNMVEVPFRAGHGNYNSSLEDLGKSAYSLTQNCVDNISGFKLIVRLIKDEFGPVGRGVTKRGGYLEVGILRNPADLPGHLLFLRIMINVKMGTSEYLPLQGAVIDFVLAEIAGMSREREHYQGKNQK
jgi:hypothetical protein